MRFVATEPNHEQVNSQFSGLPELVREHDYYLIITIMNPNKGGMHLSIHTTYNDFTAVRHATLSQAESYVRLQPNSKTPSGSNWQKTPLYFDQVNTDRNNVGLLLGNTTGFVDIDCDCPEAVHIAATVLPAPQGYFKRNDGSAHYIYRCEDAERTVRKDYKGTLIELRSDGAQTMIPPSVHPDGDRLSWLKLEATQEPAEYDTLLSWVNLIAASCLVMREYTEGKRHWLSLGYAGLLRKAGYPNGTCELVIRAIADWASDTEDRISNVKSTYENSLGKVAGYGLLSEHLSTDALTKICEWLGVTPDLTVLEGEVLDDGDLAPAIREITRDTLSEAVLSNDFAASISKQFCFVPEEKAWRYWDGTHWRKDDRSSFIHSFVSFVRSIKESEDFSRDLKDDLTKYETAYRAKSVSELCRTPCAVEIGKFNRQKEVLNCQNGMIDLNSKMLRMHDPMAYHSKVATTAYEPEATAPQFEKFVLDISDNDLEMAKYLQRVFGSALASGNSEQAVYILYGSGANGKSTLIEVVSDVMGEYARTAPSSVLVEGRSSSVGDDLVFLKDSRLISASETGQGVSLAEAKIKQVTGGDTIAARALYGSYQEFEFEALLLFSTNHLPKIRGTDEGIWRRIYVIEFKRQFRQDERDPHLKRKLLEERSGILNWLVDGYTDYRTNGLKPPASVQEANKAYRKDMDAIGQFLEDQCELQAGQRTSKTDMRRRFEWWCSENAQTGVSHSDLVQALRQRGVREIKSNSNRYWVGITMVGG